MVDILKPDLCVIGGGSGGLSVAAAARAFGASVVLIEKDKMGGDCLNTGCIPSKALIAASKHAHLAQTAGAFGVTFTEPKVDFAKVHDHVHDIIDGIAPHDSVERFEALGVTVIKEHGRFIDPHTIEIAGKYVRARRFVIATGSRAGVPPIPGLKKTPFFTNETIFDLKEKPGHLIVIGGGPIGMELAQAHQRLGARVTVIEMFDPLAKDDPELTAIALRRIEDDGVVVRANTGVAQVKKIDGGVSVIVEAGKLKEAVNGTHLLIAAGRAPNVDDLGLDRARVKFDKRGIKVNGGLKTSNRKIYAIGDVAGGLQFTHVAGYHAGLVVRNALFGFRVRENRNIIPWATYTDPEIANVGLNEAMAREKLGDNFKIMRWSYAENDRARAERQTHGLVKLITDKKGKILGCGIVGTQAGELISLYAFAIANNLKVGSLLKFIAPYPTLAEMAKRVGVEYYRDKLENPWIGRWIQLIRLLP